MTRFIKRIWKNYSKLGRRKKKKQFWRRPRGRDNKMREERKGRPAVVKIGYKRNSSSKNVFTIMNISDLENITKDDIVMLGKIGKRKKMEVVAKAKEKGIVFKNIKPEVKK